MKSYPFEGAKVFTYEEARYLKRYIIKNESPGASEITTSVETLDRGLGRFLNLIHRIDASSVIRNYSPNRMTTIYLSAMSYIMELRLDIAARTILDDMPAFDWSDEEIRPVYEPVAVSLWRKSRQRSAAADARQSALEDKVVARLADQSGSSKKISQPEGD
ncbi:hypothetical protein [Methylobacterium durans]|uniref:hypothetical protein n=1 Tax=Methylobacterium durans TaxID=2202825 RepID=UPI0013A5A694|nr:hypothetical protein [Methylobacterium durans]